MDTCCHCQKMTIRTDEEKKNLTNRMNRIIGQMNGVNRMIEENRYCDDLLIQLSAIDKSIKSLANVILEAHLHSCVKNSVQSGDEQVLDEIVDLFKRFQ